MKQMQINNQELVSALRRMAPETGSLLCLGCGHERKCSVHGCTVLRLAADRLTELSTPPPNPPLTLEELREMDGEPVWNDTIKRWMLIDLWCKHGVRAVGSNGGWREIEDRYYRRKPEEGKT